MARQAKWQCTHHDACKSCPDQVIYHSLIFDEYGIIIHDGGSAVYTISYCPFCGKKLPDSKRDRWFDELEALGYESPLVDDDIPKNYESDAWYKNR
jgi:hypothetical protein